MDNNAIIPLEQTVLGHALNNQQCFEYFVSHLDWQQFAVAEHRVIAFCLKQLASMQVAKADTETIQILSGMFPGQSKDYGGIQYLVKLKELYAEPTDNYAIIVELFKKHSIKLDIQRNSVPELLRILVDQATDLNSVRLWLKSIDDKLSDKVPSQTLAASQLVDSYITELNERPHRKVYTTGFTDLDFHLTEGFAPKRITTLAGFTGMAKSTVVVNMAHHIAVKGIGTAIFSLETISFNLLDKMLSMLTAIPVNKLVKQVDQITEEEYESIRAYTDHLRGLPLYINDKASHTIDQLYSEVKQIKKQCDIKVVFIDLFGKLDDVDTGENLAARIQKECKRMRVYGQQLDVHFVLVVQLGRQGFGLTPKGAIKRPKMTDIKNSNAFAEESDIVLLLHRNRYYKPEIQEDILEINIAKQRMGQSDIDVYFEIIPELATVKPTTSRPTL